MEEENILLNIEFNSNDIQKAVKDISSGRQQIDLLIEANKKLAEQGLKNSQAYIKNQESIKALNAEVSANSKLIQANSQATKQNADSIEQLKEKNKLLLAERNKVSTSTEEGRKKIAELNAEYDKNSKVIAANSTKVEQQRFNIGNYQSALSGVSPQLGQFTSIIGESTGKLTTAAKATEGMSFATKALLGPIALLILAGTAVINFLTGSEEGMDTLAKVTAKVEAVLSVLKGTLIGVGSALVSFATGKYSEGVDKLSNSFSGLGDRINEATKSAGELADIMDTLDELRLNNQVRNDEEENQIKNLLIQSRGRLLTEKQRNELLAQASALEKKITGEKLALQLASINASTRQFLVDSDRLDLAQREGETTVDFTKRIISEQSLLFDKRKELADQLGEYNTLLDNQANVQEKIQLQQDSIADKAVEASAKRAEADKKKAEEDQQRSEEFLKRETEAQNQLTLLKLEGDAKELTDAQARADKLIEIEQTKRTQLLANTELTEGERQLIIEESEGVINGILKAADEEKLNQLQEELDLELQAFTEYTQGLINEKKRELLEGVISQEEYNQEIQDLETAALETQAAIKEQFGEQDLALEGRITDAKIELSKKEAEIKEAQEQRKKEAVVGAINTIAGALNKQSLAYKVIASTLTTIDTIQAAISAYKSVVGIPYVGPILAVAAAAAATASGLAAVAKINNVKLPQLAQGGIIEVGGKLHSQGGEKVSISGRNVAEVERGESLVVMKRGTSPLLRNLSNINMLAGGRDFFNDRAPRYHNQDGGFVQRAASAQMNGLQTVSIDNFDKVKIGVNVHDIDRVQGQIKKANVTSELS